MSHASGQPGAGPSRRGFIGAAGATAALSSIPGLRSPSPVTAAKAVAAREPATRSHPFAWLAESLSLRMNIQFGQRT